jgi:hypothetical protein
MLIKELKNVPLVMIALTFLEWSCYVGVKFPFLIINSYFYCYTIAKSFKNTLVPNWIFTMWE